MDDDQKLQHQAQLTRWDAMYKAALDSDFAAVQIGIFVMKALVTVNGAALIAVLAAHPQLQKVPAFMASVSTVGKLFIAGIAAGLLGAIIAYFYQSFVTEKSWNEIREQYSDGVTYPSIPWADKAAGVLALLMVGFVCLSFMFFCFGSLHLLEAFSPQ